MRERAQSRSSVDGFHAPDHQLADMDAVTEPSRAVARYAAAPLEGDNRP
ncbi:hypothetical protein [Haloactinospora alba]|nr:hypothetical protein [Haloactinospora alba]